MRAGFKHHLWSLAEEESNLVIYHYTEEGDKGESKVEDNKHLLTLWIYTRIRSVSCLCMRVCDAEASFSAM